MAGRLATPDGKALYRLRKQMLETVCGIIESVMGFRQFLLRGRDKERGERSLATMARNLKRMFVLLPTRGGPAGSSRHCTMAVDDGG